MEIKITHRPVFQSNWEDNAFWHVAPWGEYYYDDQPMRPPDEILSKFA